MAAEQMKTRTPRILQALTNVVDAVGHDQHARTTGEHILVQAFEAAGRSVAAPARIDECDLALREPEQCVIFDDLPVRPGGRDAIAQENHRISIVYGVFGLAGRRGNGHQKQAQDAGVWKAPEHENS